MTEIASTDHRAPSAWSDDPLAHADADMRHVLDAYRALGGRRIEFCSVAEARRQPGLRQAADRILSRQGHREMQRDGIAIEERTVEAPDGPLALRLYRAEDLPLGAPLILFLHGGGFVVSGLDGAEPIARAMARRTRAIVVSADYRQAPEHKFPAAFEDGLASWRWLMREGRSLGGDPFRAAIMGEGVGATIALDVAARARAEGLRRPLHLVLLYPFAGSDGVPPLLQNAPGLPLNGAGIDWFIRQALPSREALDDPRLSPAHRDDLSLLPPTTLVLAEIDPLRQGGEALGEALADAGVPVESTLYEGVTHGFFGLSDLVNKAMFAEGQVANRLNRAFAPQRLSLVRP